MMKKAIVLWNKGNYSNLGFKSGSLSGSGKHSWVLPELYTNICLKHIHFGAH